MLGLSFPLPPDRPLRVLLIGAHSDDIEIGCGGSVREWLTNGVPLDVRWVVLGAEGARADEARRSADDFLAGAARAQVIVAGFRDGFLPYLGPPVKEFFESLKNEVPPDVVFTHQRFDLHQDHRIACELTYNTFRDHAVLEYEVPKWDGDLGAPNAFIPLRRQVADQKIELLIKHFGSQRSKDWFDRDTFLGLMRLRGMECRAPERRAEAFYVRKALLAAPSRVADRSGS